MSKKTKLLIVLIVVLGGIVALGVYAAPRIDAYLLARAERLEGQTPGMNDNNHLDETEEFEPVADRILADVRRAILESGSDSGSAQPESEQEQGDQPDAVSGDGNDAAEGAQSTPGAQKDVNSLALMFLMREAVISYDDAGEYARLGRNDLALSYLTEAEVLFRELLVLIDTVQPKLSGEKARGMEHLRVSAQLYLEATVGAQQLMQGSATSVDIASTEREARSELQQAREIIERE